VTGESFIGHAVSAKPLHPKIDFEPQGSLMHQDGGNSGSLASSGPLGNNTVVSTFNTTIKVILWDSNNEMVAGITHTDSVNNSTSLGIAAVNKDTLEIESSWLAEAGDILNFAYMELTLKDNNVIVSSKSGQLYVVHLDRDCEDGKSQLTLTRTIDLNATGSLGTDELLLNSMLDTNGNIWFTTGGIRAQAPGSPGDPVQNSSTVGYVEPDGAVHTYHIPNQMIENGIAITNDSVYVVTGPAGDDDHANANGYVYCFKPGPRDSASVTVIWSATYPSGDTRKPGAFARGSGSTPALLGDQYVAITDNDNEQIHMLIYSQKAAVANQNQLDCSVPIFQPGGGNNDLGILTNFDGATYGLVVFNDYDAPLLYSSRSDINGNFNNMSKMAAEVVKVDVPANGQKCSVVYDTPVRIKSVPVLSVATGLIYGYTQSEEATTDGLYEWYTVALDWQTGEAVWQVRTGAGGTLNDNFMAATLGSDGTLYQAVVDGVVALRDIV
jgi:hypothetical protein